jgi:hypothetical protein
MRCEYLPNEFFNSQAIGDIGSLCRCGTAFADNQPGCLVDFVLRTGD